MSKHFPWLDATEDAKYLKGEHGKTSDRWLSAPKLDPCWRGDYREWHIEDGKCSQVQCYCRFWRRWINASGAACVRCTQRAWPDVELYRAHFLPGLDKEAQEAAVLRAVQSGQLTEAEAVKLGAEFELGRSS